MSSCKAFPDTLKFNEAEQNLKDIVSDLQHKHDASAENFKEKSDATSAVKPPLSHERYQIF